jgi:solute carrier family 25 carnitine/acylcarnitine transporter 20/29
VADENARARSTPWDSAPNQWEVVVCISPHPTKVGWVLGVFGSDNPQGWHFLGCARRAARMSEAAFVAGLISGAAGQLIGHPLDTLKVHAQAASAERLAVRALWRGATVPVLTAGGIQSLALGIFENTRRTLWPYASATPLPHLALAGSTCGLCASLVTCPLSRVKVLQQLTGKQFLPVYRGAVASGTLFRALPTVALWESTRGSYMVVYALLKRHIPASSASSPAVSESPLPLWARVAAGGGANVLNMAVWYPLNTVLNVQQSEVPPNLATAATRSPAHAGRGAGATAMAMWAEGGVRRFYRGYAYTLLRAGPVAAAIMPMFEILLPHLERLQGQMSLTL